MHRAFFPVVLLSLLVARADAVPSVSDSNIGIQPLVPASTFANPTQIRFLGADDLFVTEKNTGQVKRMSGGNVTTVLNLNVANDSERGLLGLTLDPEFKTNGFVYLYYSATSGAADGGAWADNR